MHACLYTVHTISEARQQLTSYLKSYYHLANSLSYM